MQDEVNEKTIALYIKTGKLTAQTLQKAMKAILSKGKKQLAKPPQGKQSLKPVSYTHLDVYKRQALRSRVSSQLTITGSSGKTGTMAMLLSAAGSTARIPS